MGRARSRAGNAPGQDISRAERNHRERPRDRGGVLRASKCRLLRSGIKNCWIEITLDEGKNRQIRRILEALGVEVLRLVRVAIGPLQLGVLGKGTYRRLEKSEKHALDRTMAAVKQTL